MEAARCQMRTFVHFLLSHFLIDFRDMLLLLSRKWRPLGRGYEIKTIAVNIL